MDVKRVTRVKEGLQNRLPTTTHSSLFCLAIWALGNYDEFFTILYIL